MRVRAGKERAQRDSGYEWNHLPGTKLGPILKNFSHVLTHFRGGSDFRGVPVFQMFLTSVGSPQRIFRYLYGLHESIKQTDYTATDDAAVSVGLRYEARANHPIRMQQPSNPIGWRHFLPLHHYPITLHLHRPLLYPVQKTRRCSEAKYTVGVCCGSTSTTGGEM